MSSFPTRPGEQDRTNENRPTSGDEEEDEESSAAESEEVDQLLLSYRRNPIKKRSSAALRRADLDSPTSTSGGGGDEIVVVSIEHHEEPELPSDRGIENEAASPSDIWLQNESTCSSASLLRDLLPHMSESNTNAAPPSSTASCQASFLSKTYTEPTSLSGLLRQVGNRLFSHYPSRVVRRHSKISPTASIHCKLDDADDAASSSQTTVLTTTTAPLAVDEKSSEIAENLTSAREESLPSASSLSPASNTLVRRFFEQQHKQEKHRKRLPAESPLCKRCPHCRKTCPLRKISIPENLNKYESLPSNSCSCRICMILASVESTLPSDGGRVEASHFPASSTTVDLSTFSNEEAPCGGSCEGLVRAGHVSLSGISLELGLFCDECNTTRSAVQKSGEHSQSCSKIVSEISSCSQQKTPQQQKSREQGIQVNSSSMASIATTSSFGGPVCRICHSPGDKLEPLISPCRCLGTLKYVHASCLLHWLDISSRKLRRPPHCELCGYRYQRHKTMKLRRIQWPTCSRRDKLYHVLFLISVLMMIACAAVTIVCFKADRAPRSGDSIVGGKPAGSSPAGGGGPAGSPNANGGPAANAQVELSGQEVITLVCGILFFCAFFVAMYVQVKAQTTVYKLCVRFWTMNQEWRVEEYKREKDAEYWRQRQEQQQLQQRQQQQRRVSAQLSSASAAAGNAHTPLIYQQQQQVSRPSLSLSQSSSSSFRADALNGID